MLYFSKLKTMLILGACALGVLLSLPNLLPAPADWVPWRGIHLGLDLRGGSYLLMEVDMGAVIKERLEGLADSTRRSLERAGVRPYILVIQNDRNRLLVKPGNPDQTGVVESALRELGSTAGQGVSARPDLNVTTDADGVALTLSEVALNERASQAVIQSIEIVRRRIDETGVVDPLITRQGQNRIVVQLPGIEDPNRIKTMLGKTARMTFQLVDETANPNAAAPPPGVLLLPMQDRPGEKIAVRRRVEVDGGDLTDARAGQNGQTGEWVVNFTFNSLGARRFADISRANVGHRFAVVLDNKVITAPVIRDAITSGRGEISGIFTAASGHYRLTEYCVVPGGAYEVSGTCVENANPSDEYDRNLITKGGNEPTFLISSRTEKALKSMLRRKAALHIFGGAALSVACLALLLAKFGWL